MSNNTINPTQATQPTSLNTTSALQSTIHKLTLSRVYLSLLLLRKATCRSGTRSVPLSPIQFLLAALTSCSAMAMR